MLEYLMVLGHQQVQCSLQSHTYFLSWSSTGYQQATIAVTLSSVGTQCKLHKHKVQNKSQMDGTEQCWGQDKMAAIFQKTFCNTFSWMKMYEFQLRFRRSLFLRVKLTALVQIMAWCWPGDKPLSEPMMVSLLTQICITWPQWVKTSL